MAKTLAEYSEDVPSYALSYIINGDASGIEDEDQENAAAWMEWFTSKAKELGGSVVYSPTEDTYCFCSCPAFGLACETTKVDVLIIGH